MAARRTRLSRASPSGSRRAQRSAHETYPPATSSVRARAPLRLSSASASTLQTLSQKLHAYLDAAAPRDLFGNRLQPTLLYEALRREKRGAKPRGTRYSPGVRRRSNTCRR